MIESRPFSFTLRVFIGLAAFGLTLFFMREAASMINALMLSIIIVLSASPLLRWLQRKKVPDWLAYVLTLLVIVAVFGILILLLIVAVGRLSEALPTYQAELDATVESFESALEEVDVILQELGLSGADLSADAQAIITPEQALDWLMGFFNGLVNVFSNVVLVGLIVIFLLIDTFNLPQKIAGEIESGNLYVKRIFDFGTDIRQYVYITTIVGLVTGVFDTVLFLIMGVDFAVLWGILAFLLSYVPTIGFWLAAIPPTLLALLESGPAAALVVFLGIVIINGIAENVVKPRSMGSGLNLSPFVVVFSVIFWSAILGPFGAILSIPMTLIVKELVLEVDDQNAWMATLLSAGPRPEPPEATDDGAPAGESSVDSSDQSNV